MFSARSLRRLRTSLNPVRIAGIVFVVAIIAVTLLAPFLGLPDPLAQDIANQLLPIGAEGHPLGTDRFGRDILSRLIFGARVELVIALGATTVALVLGTLLGLIGATSAASPRS